MPIASSIRRRCSSPVKISASATNSRSTFAARSAINSRRLWRPGGSLFGDDRARDAVSRPLAARDHERGLEQIPDRNDQRQIAHQRAAVTAVIAMGRQEAKTEHALAERPAAVAVAEK